MKAAISSIPSSAVRIWKSQNRSLRLLRITFFSLAILMGLLQTLEYRNVMNVDGISYLDMGDAYLRGGWKMLVNGHWSPMYPWLLGVATALFKPSSYWEFAMLHLVNFVAYLVALFSFDLMLRQVIAGQATYHDDEHSPAPLPDWAFMAISYTIFMFSSLRLIDMKQESPDMLMSGFVYLATALILYIRRTPGSWLAFFFLGTALGLGYLAKAPMFPLSFVYLGVALILGGGLRKAVPRFLLALTVFLATSSPLVVALSRAKGHLTFGESGKLNQLWNINGAQPAWYWQDSSRISGTGFSVGHGRGKFLHPPRLIFRDPPVYEFTSPVEATQPAWYDPSYWMEGAAPRFELKRQCSVIVENLAVYFDMLFTDQGALLAIFLTLCLLGAKCPDLDGLVAQWPMLLPALAALAMYALVLVHPRYVGTFVAVAWTGLFAGLRLPSGIESKKIIIPATLALVIAMGAPLTRAAVHSLTNGIRHRPHPQWQVAQALHQMGVAPGDKVARVGGTFGADWARLLRARVVAEVPRTSAPEFWTAAPSVQEQVLKVLRQTGARIVVAQQIPPLEEFVPAPGWTRIGKSDFYLFQLQRDSVIDFRAGTDHAASQSQK